MQFLYDAAVHTLVLLSADEIVPGPYTYRRFWFRDACLMMNALLAIGLDGPLPAGDRALSRAAAAQRLLSLAGRRVGFQRAGAVDSRPLRSAHGRAAVATSCSTPSPRPSRWIDRKRVPSRRRRAARRPAAGGLQRRAPGPERPLLLGRLLGRGRPARGGADLRSRRPPRTKPTTPAQKADDLRAAIERSIAAHSRRARSLGGIPASPYRRIDAGAIGSLVADYPLQLYPPGGAARSWRRSNALMQRCFHHGGFFQDIIHSGINAYLTLDIAQTLLRAGDPRYRELDRSGRPRSPRPPANGPRPSIRRPAAAAWATASTAGPRPSG